MITPAKLQQIEATKYDLLGRGSHSEGDLHKALQLAILIEIVCPIIEQNTLVLQNLLTLLSERK